MHYNGINTRAISIISAVFCFICRFFMVLLVIYVVLSRLWYGVLCMLFWC